MHNDRRNKRKNDPAAAREPSSRVAHAVVPPSAAPVSPMSAQQQQPQLQHSYQQQQHRSGRGMSRDASQGAKALRSLSGLQTTLPGHGLRTSSCGSLQQPGKRQRLAQAPQLLQPDPASHSALVAAMLAHGGMGGGSLHPGTQISSGLSPGALHSGLLQHGGMFHPGLNAAGLLGHTAPGLSGQQAYQDALSAVAAVQSLQAQQDPVAAAAAAHRIAGGHDATSRMAQLAGQLAAAQAAAGANPFAGAAAPQLLAASSASSGGGGGGGEGLRAPCGESAASAAAYLQALQAVQQQAARQRAAQQAHQHPGALASQGLRSASLSAISAGFTLQQHSAPPTMGHLMAAGRELSLNSVYSQPGMSAAPRPPSTGFSGGVQQGPKSTATRRGSGLTEQLSEASMWSRRSSNTVVDAGAFLSATAGPMAAAAAIADSSLRTASVTTLPRSTPPPGAGVSCGSDPWVQGTLLCQSIIGHGVV